MIGVKLEGRLGNQMFQYAFALAYSKKIKSDWFIKSTRDIPFLLPEFFELNSYSSFMNYLRKKRFLKKLQEIDFENDLLPHENLKSLRPNSIINGYFQSEEYFKEISPIIKMEFEIKKKYIKMK